MFGLSFEKLFLIALLAAVVIGPRRLPEYAGHIGRAVRVLRTFVDGARATAAETTGMPLEQWRSVDLSQYDPRRIVREALADDPVAAPVRRAWTDAEIAAIRPGQRFVVVGGSAHPQRIAIADLADDDPVRRAAEQIEAQPLVEV